LAIVKRSRVQQVQFYLVGNNGQLQIRSQQLMLKHRKVGNANIFDLPAFL